MFLTLTVESESLMLDSFRTLLTLQGRLFHREEKPYTTTTERNSFGELCWPLEGISRDRRNHDSQRRDRILRFFLCPEIGQFSPHFGAISLLNCTENLEKGETNPLEKTPQKSSGENSPKLLISVPCRGRTCVEFLLW